MSAKNACWCMFFLGLFIRTQVHLIGYIGLSELIVVFVAPFIYAKNHIAMKRDGMMPVLNLAVMAILGCVLSSLVNGSVFAFFIRGFAQTYTTWAALVVGYHLLRSNLMSYRWFILGAFLSGILSIYIMQGAAATMGGIERTGGEAVEVVKSGVLFWKNRVLPAINLPVSMYYLECPYLYSVMAPMVYAGFSLFLSEGSGRGSFVVSMVSSFLILIGGRKGHGLAILKRNLFPILVVGIFLLGGVKSVYSRVASTGRLGEKAEQKYRDQTERGSGMLSMLISGRTDFFVGLYACLKKPIVGHGPWPLDKEGYRVSFLRKYGTNEEVRNATELYGRYAMKTIPAHSHLVGYWLEYGILGLPFWLYVLWLMFRYFRRDVDTVPALFGLFALGIPSVIWSILFNPYSSRVGIPIMISALILIHARKRQFMQVVWR